ncbi:MAG TPA: PPC domain-containing protein [Kofleriaceae bacterium]|nr:PPC domain-containing protein [Kofleriaceae bacterium]
MASTTAAVISYLGASALVLAAACGGGGGTPDASPTPDAPSPADAAASPDGEPDATHPDGPIPVDGSTCNVPIDLAPGASASGDTTGMARTTTGTCSLGSGSAKETKYLVDLGDTPVDLVLHANVNEAADPPFDVVLYARTMCGSADTELVCADAGWSERADLLAVSGPVYIMVDGTYQHGGAMEGAYDLDTAVRTIAAESDACDPAGITSRCATGFRCASSVCVTDSPAAACAAATVLDVGGGSATATGATFAYAADHYDGTCAYDPDAGLGEQIFSITVPAGADLTATTDNATTDFDTYLYLRTAACDGTEVACADDVDTVNNNLKSTLTATNLSAGTYYLFVDGSSNSPGTGTFKLDVTVAP